MYFSFHFFKPDSDTMDTTNSFLIQKALEGDESACAAIVARYRGQIYSLVLRMVKNREEAEDLTQETFIKAFRALATFNAEYAFSTWLYKIAANNCIDFFRKKRLKTFPLDNPIQVKDGELHREYPTSDQGPEHGLISKEKSLQIQEAIDSLPKKYKEAIILRHSKDKSYEDIAAELNIPLGTVKVRIFRAREMLKKRLKDQLRP